jgi:membrane protease YdiL (CAAX protease family)
MILIKTKFKQSLSDFGLGLGDWKFGLTVIGVTTILSPFLVYQSAQSIEHLTFYRNEFPLLITSNSPTLFAAWCLTLLPHYIGYEFFYRGYILFGLEKRIGSYGAILFQTTLTILMHIGKPMGETWGAAIGGILMGLLVLRTRSIWYVVIFHWLLGVFNAYFCAP